MPPPQICGHHLDAEFEHLERLDEPISRGFVTVHEPILTALQKLSIQYWSR